jgi:TatD DNase family protein
MGNPSVSLVDIHTHNVAFDRQIAILNVYPNNPIPDNLPANNYCSSGLHPWYPEEWEKQFESLSALVRDKKIIAIGECGLDKKTDTLFSLQENIFNRQVELSEQYKLPLIIHCVKAHNELIQTRIRFKPEMTWIVHSFNSNLEIANQCLNSGMILSFGKILLQNDAKIVKVVKDIPVSKIFLETDDSGISILEIYNCYAKIKNMKLEVLKTEMLKNFKECFKINQ